MARLAPTLLLLSRFGLVGALNTAIGFSVIVGLDIGLGVDPRIANAIGYLVGFGVSYGLNRGFVFRSAERATASGPRFIVAALAAFGLNQLVLALSMRLLGAGEAARIASQLAGLAAYTAALFLACRFWVFRDKQPVIASPHG